MKKLLLSLSIFCSFIVTAAPEIKGSPEEIEQYLDAIPKTISISGRAERVLNSTKAKINLSVKTESKSLADALKQNYKIRAGIRKKLLELGIVKSDINESKFSSTPEYGIFGDEPKSYTVSNVLLVLVSSEEQMISVADLSDKDKSIRYLSSKPTIVGEDKIKDELVLEALQSAKEKAQLFEDELDVELVPVQFSESATNVTDQNVMPQSRSKVVSSVISYDKPNGFGEQKLSMTISLTYKLIPNPK